MRRTSIKPARMYELAREFLGKRKVVVSHDKGGRPRDYDDALILTIACIQNLHQFSFREALEFCGDIFPELPALSTYHYRLSKIKPDIAQGFVAYLGKKVQKENGASNGIRFFVMDGTGFSFHDAYPMRFHLGTEIRKIAAHVKAVVLIGIFGANRRFVLAANAGRPYASEVKLVQPLLDDLPQSHGYLLGDKAYDSHDVIAAGIEKGLRPVIAIKQGRLRKKIKDPLRIISKKNADNPKLYDKRTLVEGMFGNVKQKLTSHIRIFRLDIAQTFALLRFALFNMSVLASLENARLLWIWFSNSLMTRNTFDGYDIEIETYPKSSTVSMSEWLRSSDAYRSLAVLTPTSLTVGNLPGLRYDVTTETGMGPTFFLDDAPNARVIVIDVSMLNIAGDPALFLDNLPEVLSIVESMHNE